MIKILLFKLLHSLRNAGKFFYTNTLKITVLLLASTSTIAQRSYYENKTTAHLDPLLPLDSYSNIMVNFDHRCNDFMVLSGNIDNSKRILLGELHTNKMSTNLCLDDLSANKVHKILVGSAPLGLSVPCVEHDIEERPGRSCEGWNNATQLQSAVKYYQEYTFVHAMHMLYEKYNEGVSAKKIDEYLKIALAQILKKYKRFTTQLNTNAQAARDSLTSYSLSERSYLYSKYEKKLCIDILRKRQGGKTYPEIFAEYLDEVKQADNECMHYLASIPKQVYHANKSMLDALRAQKGFAIVVAGKAQIIQETEEDKEAIDYLYSELNKDKDQNPYAILALNEFR